MHPKFSRALIVLVAFGAPLLTACGRKGEPAEVTISLRDPQSAIASATILVDYSQAGAKPLQTGGELSCATIVPNVTADFSDDGQGHLTIHARAPQGLSSPVDLAICRMIPEAAGTTPASIASKLRISMLEGTDKAGASIGTQRVARGGETRREQRDEAATKSHDRETRGEERLAQGEGTAGGTPGGGEAAPPAADSGHTAAEAGKAASTPGDPSTVAPGAKTRANSLMPGSEQGSASRDSGIAPGGAFQSGAQNQAADGGGGSGESNEDADTDRAARSYEIVVGVTNDAGKLGALQFDIIHSGSGGFAGAAGSARCSTQVPAALATFNDKGRGTLSGALIDLDGIPTPGPVASCTFRSREAVTTADFSVRVVDSAATEGGPPERSPQMAIVSMRALD